MQEFRRQEKEEARLEEVEAKFEEEEEEEDPRPEEEALVQLEEDRPPDQADVVVEPRIRRLVRKHWGKAVMLGIALGLVILAIWKFSEVS